MDNQEAGRIITEYVSEHTQDNCDLCTLWYLIGDDAFLKAILRARGRRIILYHDPADFGKCDPPIHWKYARKQ